MAAPVSVTAASEGTADDMISSLLEPGRRRLSAVTLRSQVVRSPGLGRDRMQINRLKRRQFITMLGGAAVSWPLAARAQQRERVRRVGVLLSTGADDRQDPTRLAAFAQGLHELGWTASSEDSQEPPAASNCSLIPNSCRSYFDRGCNRSKPLCSRTSGHCSTTAAEEIILQQTFKSLPV